MSPTPPPPPSSPAVSPHWGASFALIAVVLGGLGAALERPWPTDDALPAFLATHRLSIVGQSLFFMAGACCNLWFLGGLEAFLASDARASRWARVAFGAGLLWCGLNVVGQAPQVVLSLPAEAQLPPSLARMLADLCFVTLNLANLPLAVMFAAIAVATFRTGRFPTWLGALALVAAVAAALLVGGLAVGSGPLAPQGWLTILLYPASVLWLVPAAIFMLRANARTKGLEAGAA